MSPGAAKRLNISADLCHTIRRKIADGELPPGSHVNEVHLARKLEVSRTPLREALSQLTAEGLLESKPRRGFFARSLSLRELEQLYPLRSLLDPQALCMAGIPPRAQIADLRRINGQIQEQKARPARVIDLDDRWHRTLLSHCNNKILLDFIDQLIWKSRRYEHAYMSQQTNIEVATTEHEQILDALERSDLALACRLLKKNMTSAKEPLIAWLKSQGITE